MDRELLKLNGISFMISFFIVSFLWTQFMSRIFRNNIFWFIFIVLICSSFIYVELKKDYFRKKNIENSNKIIGKIIENNTSNDYHNKSIDEALKKY